MIEARIPKLSPKKTAAKDKEINPSRVLREIGLIIVRDCRRPVKTFRPDFTFRFGIAWRDEASQAGLAFACLRPVVRQHFRRRPFLKTTLLGYRPSGAGLHAAIDATAVPQSLASASALGRSLAFAILQTAGLAPLLTISLAVARAVAFAVAKPLPLSAAVARTRAGRFTRRRRLCDRRRRSRQQSESQYCRSSDSQHFFLHKCLPVICAAECIPALLCFAVHHVPRSIF